MVKLAQDLDELDYERYWIAEHHNAPNLVSSATVFYPTYFRANFKNTSGLGVSCFQTTRH